MSDMQNDATASPTPPERPPAPRPREGAPVTEAMHLRATIGVFRQHLMAFFVVVLLVPACAWIAIQRTSPQYTATGSLIYDPAEYKARELQSILLQDPITEVVLASQAEILQSLKVAQRVAERGNLYANPEFNRSLQPPSRTRVAIDWVRSLFGADDEASDTTDSGTGDVMAGGTAKGRASGRASGRDSGTTVGPAPNAARDATVQAVREALHAAPVRGSRVLEVTFTAQDPLVAAAAVNNAMDIYIKDQFTAKAAAVHRATAWLDERAGTLRGEVRKAEDKIAAYRAKYNFAQGMHAGLFEEKISHLNEDLISARAGLAAADARLDAARGGAGVAEQAAIAPSVVPLRTSLDQLTAQLQAQSGRLGANHPDAESARRQVEQARKAVAAEIARVVAASESDRRASAVRVATLARNLEDARRDADEEAKARIPLNAMERDAEAARAELLAMLERIQQTAQQHAIETSEAHEISLAMAPRTPSWPRTAPTMAAAVGAGVLLGLMTVHFLNLLDTTLHTGEDVRSATKLRCFALVPELTRRDLRRFPIEDFTARRPLTVFSEQIRAVRAALWLGTQRPRVVAIAAARPAEGKSVLALSLARSASLSGEKVLLIDCDLRRPSLAGRLGAANAPGLSDFLRGTAKLAEVLHADPAGSPGGGMHFIPAGKPCDDAFGLFMGPEMARLLVEARQQYALIVLDSPPVQAITEARVLAAVADATVLCVRWHATPRDVVRRALELLQDAHAQVVGVVLTRVDPRAQLRSGYADAEVYHRRYKPYYTG
jgi:capsular exopolysaccharide synthesis family protein